MWFYPPDSHASQVYMYISIAEQSSVVILFSLPWTPPGCWAERSARHVMQKSQPNKIIIFQIRHIGSCLCLWAVWHGSGFRSYSMHAHMHMIGDSCCSGEGCCQFLHLLESIALHISGLYNTANFPFAKGIFLSQWHRTNNCFGSHTKESRIKWYLISHFPLLRYVAPLSQLGCIIIGWSY